MPMTQEEQQEYRDSAELLSADELRGMRGDDPEEDAIIDSILNKGVAVEVPGGAKDEGDDDAGPAPAGDPDGDPDADPDADPDGNPDADPAADPVVDAPAPADDPAPAADPEFVAPPLDLSGLTVELNEKLAALAAEKRAALKQMMDGTIDPDAYADLDEKNTLAREELRDQQAATAKWFTAVHDFQVKAAKETGVNYFTDAEKFQALDQWVKVLAAKGAPAGASETWFLEQAHKKVMVEFDIAPPTPKTAETGTKNVADGKKVAPKTVRTPNLSNIPPTLGGLPAAAPATGGDGGEFAHLDKLSGIEYERAIARMTPDQRDRWSSM
jgi:hypothetical protein